MQLNGSSFLHQVELQNPLMEIRQRENDNKNIHTSIKVEEKKRESLCCKWMAKLYEHFLYICIWGWLRGLSYQLLCLSHSLWR